VASAAFFGTQKPNKFLAAAAQTVVVIAPDAKSCLLNSGNGNANSRTKAQSEQQTDSAKGTERDREREGEEQAKLQMCKSN